MNWQDWLVDQLVTVKVFEEERRREGASPRKLIESLFSSSSNEHDSFDRKLLATLKSDLLKLFLVVRFVEIYESVEVLQVTMVLDVVDLAEYFIDVLALIAKVLDLLEEIFDLLFLNLKFAVLEVKVEYSPDLGRIKLGEQLSYLVLCDEWYVILFISEKMKSFLDFVLNILNLLCLLQTVRRINRVLAIAEDPVSLVLQLIF